MSAETYDNISNRLIDGLRESIKAGDKLSVAGVTFSIYAYEALKQELRQIKGLRFLYTSPTFTSDKEQKAAKEFFIPQHNREQGLFGTEFEIKLRNKLTQRAIARECAEWIRRSCSFKSCLLENSMLGQIIVDRGADSVQFFPVTELTTTSLGIEKGNTYATQILRLTAPNATTALSIFDSIWNDTSRARDVTDKVLENIETLYRENAPEFLYFVTLANIFTQFLDDLNQDNLPKEETGFQQSVVWRKLFNFQRDAALGLIQKLEKYNGCILADSVGLGKTFTALAVIKYYESRNQNVLVLCPKKLALNWTTYKNNYHTNILAPDRLRYDVLFHSDLSRTRGTSNGIDLSLINWGNYDLVVIDESHNFRNGYATDSERENRYEKLMKSVIKSGIRTKVLMLSATPVNNRFSDLRNQLQLAYEGDASQINEQLPLKAGIDGTFRQAQKAYNLWAKLPPEERTTANLQKSLPFDFFEILDAVTIARSRRHIERYYDTTDIGKFPKRLAPESRQPQLTNKPNAPRYREIFDLIRQLNLAVYTPSSFILPTRIAKYADLGGAKGLSLEGRELGIRRLMSVNLLKRLESSVNSFRLTVQRVRGQVASTLDLLHNHRVKKVHPEQAQESSIDPDEADDLEDISSIETKKLSIDLDDMDIVQWTEYLQQDVATLDKLISRLADITPKGDSKLAQLKLDICDKISQPFNPGNRKVLIFTAFADTAEYLYENIAPDMLRKFGVHTALVTGQVESRCNLNLKKPLSFDQTLTLFSPVSKEKAVAYPDLTGSIDILIATDCISEGQNLQDCDCIINFDIHWNPVRIIQRFGRVDRIGSSNAAVKMINYWPDIALDEYIDLKARVEARMKVSVLASTGDENPLSTEEKNELKFREEQLKRLQHEVIDLEDMNTGVSIMDLGLNEFRTELLAYLKEHPETARSPHGLHAVVASRGESPQGVVFVLRSTKVNEPLDTRNRIHPFYMVYVKSDGDIFINHLEIKQLLDLLRHLTQGCAQPDEALCRAFNRETHDGSKMEKYSALLNSAIQSISEGMDRSGLDAFLDGDPAPLFSSSKKEISDFELVSFFVIRETH